MLQNARAFLFNPIQVRDAMSKSTVALFARVASILVIFLIAQAAVRAQVSKPRTGLNDPVVAPAKPETATDERLKTLEEELRSQRRSIDEMRA